MKQFAIALAVSLSVGLGSAGMARAATVEHGSKGFEFSTEDGRYLLQIDTRMQFRLSHPSDDNPVTFEPEPDHTSFELRRARLKVGGHAGQEWLKYYWEFDFPSSNLLDFRVTMQWQSWFGVRVGQWKARYTRERVISSGKQQMMDRSLINRPFTIDRQQGASVLGRLGIGQWYSVDYWASAFTGTGRGGGTNDDENLMYMIRLQWNPLDGRAAFVGSDLGRSDPALSLTVAGVTNRSQYTRFSTSGGGSLTGFADEDDEFDPAVAGQFRVKQAMLESAFIAHGFAWQQEYHYKEIDDRVEGATTILTGNYMQAGYFFSELVEFVPPELEFAVRHAWYDPGLEDDGDDEFELSFVANWFFSGHRSKLTASTTWLDYELGEGETREEWRVQLQWDVSL